MITTIVRSLGDHAGAANADLGGGVWTVERYALVILWTGLRRGYTVELAAARVRGVHAMRSIRILAALAALGLPALWSSSAAAHVPSCVETVNPHGETVPPAGSTTLPGPRGGQNEDGFYLIGSDTGGSVFVVDLGTGTTFGPYPTGTVVKYTQSPGATPTAKDIGSDNGQAGAVDVHIQGQGDMGVRTGDGGVVACLVPPPPK
jgi:hypothetical protein